MPASGTGGHLTCTTRSRHPVAVLVLRGDLTEATASTARDSMIKILVDQPTALVVDLDGVNHTDAAGLAVFGAVARHAAQWPETAVMLGGRRDLHEQIQIADSTPSEVFTSVAEAVAAAASRPVARSCRLACGTGIDAPARARRIATTVFRGWAVPDDLVARAVLIVSEFVANAVRHARTRSELMLNLQGRRLHIAVRDTCRRLPQVSSTTDIHREDGRGLGIVGRLAASWGVVADSDGKVVWAALCL
jgi:anti-anti-sigma regulatory factor/anti-sigma regulatory factor (Ser/Thr protein kinase)